MKNKNGFNRQKAGKYSFEGRHVLGTVRSSEDLPSESGSVKPKCTCFNFHTIV